MYKMNNKNYEKLIILKRNYVWWSDQDLVDN